MTENDNNEEHESIISELKQLRLQQLQILSRINHLIDRLEPPPTADIVKSESIEDGSTATANSKRNEKKGRIREGQRVIIKNPKEGESSTGTATGFTRTGQVRLKLDSGHVTRRICRNVVIETPFEG